MCDCWPITCFKKIPRSCRHCCVIMPLRLSAKPVASYHHADLCVHYGALNSTDSLKTGAHLNSVEVSDGLTSALSDKISMILLSTFTPVTFLHFSRVLKRVLHIISKGVWSLSSFSVLVSAYFFQNIWTNCISNMTMLQISLL